MDNTNPPPEVLPSFLIEKVLKLNPILESLNLKTQSFYSGVICKKEIDSVVMLIELIKDDEYPSGDELNKDDDVGEEEYEEITLTNSQLVGITCCFGKPFVEQSGMTYDSSLGVVRLTNGNEEIAYKIPHKIEQYNSLSNDEKENMKSVYLRNDEDKKKGVEYIMSKILGYYKECLELGPKYRTGQDEISSGTSENQNGEVTKYLMDMRAENFEREKKYNSLQLVETTSDFPNGVPTLVIFDKEKPKSSLEFHEDNSWMTI
ncbi:hypothetical protein Tco_1455562 [Tanacetum coccineum]